LNDLVAQGCGIAAGDDHLGKTGIARGGRSVLADRKQRQLQKAKIRQLRRDGTDRIGRRNDDGAVARLTLVMKGDRLELEHRREQHHMPPRA
jgi:hypothetical protein